MIFALSLFRFEEFTPFSYSAEPLFSNERVITVEGNLDSVYSAEKEISRKLRQCMERDMKTLMTVCIPCHLIFDSRQVGIGM